MSDRFATVCTEGSILPANLLQRITAGDDGLATSSYHSSVGEKTQRGHQPRLESVAKCLDVLPRCLGKTLADRLSYLYLPSVSTDRLREYRITSIALYWPWLNLLNLDGAA